MTSQKTVLITGASSGIGHALAREFHSRGFRVFATARSTSSITDLSSQGITALPLEATSSDSIAALVASVRAATDGKLDYLVNNAGRNYTVPALDVELSEIRQTFETNVFSVMMLCQAFAPLLVPAKGTIVQIGSIAAIMPYVFGSVYNASKGALHSYSNTLRVELEPFDVKVVTVVTGGVTSKISRTHRDLPGESIYVPIAQEYEERQTHSQANAVSAEAYAKRVVDQLVRKPKRDTIWEGGKSWLVWFVSTFLPRYWMDRTMSRMFKLWKLRSSDGEAKKLT